jgi:hypothetical protein
MKRAVIVAWLLAAITLGGCIATGMGPAPHGTVSVATVAPPAGLYRLVLQEVDGKLAVYGGARRVSLHVSLMVVDPGFDISDARSDFDLPPGEHTLSFTAIVDRPDARLFVNTPSRQAGKAAGELKLTVEAGKRYLVAAKVIDIEPDQWQPVVYKVDDIPPHR